ncbi:MAG: serine protease, partial [Bacteroides sp.]|uniref:S1 family peptidase n=1 Tax=Bacteroides sp. TaxID=29523 RepID=UPI002FC8AB5B
MNLNIDDFGGKSVVPVYCGSYVSGTAFFISPTILLTAGHVLAEYILDKEASVAIIVDGDYKFCRVLCNYAEPDVAVLECGDYQSPKENVLKLLNCKYKTGIEALVVGYPRELGNGVDYFGVTVKNSREKADLKGGFDRMVIRTDSFGFNSYEGFSGSPVINAFGMVMGIQTDQLYNTLGYVSVNAIKPSIEHHIGVEIEENEDLYDNTPYGLCTSRNHIRLHTCDMLKTRYNSKVHIEDKQTENTILSFCGYGIEKERIEIYDLFIIWFAKLAGVRRQNVESIDSIKQYLQDCLITDVLIVEIGGLLYE